MTNITDKIVRLRKYRKLTQKEVAERLGFSIVGYSKIERGETSLTIDRLYQICEILDVNINYFFIEQIDDNTFKMLDEKKELSKNKIEQYQNEQNNYEEKVQITELVFAFHNLFYNLSIKIVGGLVEANPRVHFYNNLNLYLNNLSNDSKGFSWFVEFISIYNIEGLKNRYQEFFNLVQVENNHNDLNDILHNYEIIKKDITLKRLVNEWYAYFFSKLYTELFENNTVYSFLKDNEKDFELLADKQIFSLWLEYKKSKEQG